MEKTKELNLKKIIETHLQKGLDISILAKTLKKEGLVFKKIKEVLKKEGFSSKEFLKQKERDLKQKLKTHLLTNPKDFVVKRRLLKLKFRNKIP